MITGILIILAFSVVISLLTVLVLFRIGKHSDAGKAQDDDSRYYDENGNHLYYDRKLIARLEKKKERAAQPRKQPLNNPNHP